MHISPGPLTSLTNNQHQSPSIHSLIAHPPPTFQPAYQRAGAGDRQNGVRWCGPRREQMVAISFVQVWVLAQTSPPPSFFKRKANF